MGAVNLYRRNPFSFPAGNPGLDPTHPVLSSGAVCRFSYVASLSGGFNLIPPNNVSIGAGISAANIHPTIGPTVHGGMGAIFANCPAPPTTANDYPLTLACIGTQASTGQRCYVTTSGPIETKGCFMNAAGIGNWGLETFEGGGTIDTGVSVGNASGIVFPFFCVISFDGSTINCVYLRLDTFKLVYNSQSASIANLHSQGGEHGLFHANEGAQQVAAGTAISAAASIPQMLTWAADPWAFWYPPAMQQIMFSGLRGQISGGAPALFSRALLGVGL